MGSMTLILGTVSAPIGVRWPLGGQLGGQGGPLTLGGSLVILLFLTPDPV